MARFGRSQPHPPIILRGPATVLATVTIAAGVHIIGQADQRARLHPARQPHIVFLRPSRSSLVPDRLPPQVTIYGQAQERATRIYLRRQPIVLVRGSPNAAPAAPTTTPKPIINAQAAQTVARIRRGPTSLAVWIINPPGDGVAVVTPPAVKSVIVAQAQIQARRHPARQSRIIQERNPAVIVPDRLAPQITVLSQAMERPRVPVHRRAAIIIQRGVGQFFPAKLPAQPIVITQAQERPRQPIHRHGAILFARNPAVVVTPKGPAQPYIVSQAIERARFPLIRRLASIFFRNPNKETPPGTPAIALSADLLLFEAEVGEPAPPSQQVVITNSGTGGTLSPVLSTFYYEGASWLVLNLAGLTITVSVDTTGLTAGVYHAAVIVASVGASNTPQTLMVALRVTGDHIDTDPWMTGQPGAESGPWVVRVA